MKKSFTKILTLVLSLLVVVALAACGKTKAPATPTDAPVNYQAMLDNYLLEIDGKTVSKDFVLPKTISANDKTYAIAWESDNAAVAIEAREDDYLAKVTYPEQTVTVTLTLHLENLTKSFTVLVEGLEPTTFSQAYSFPKDKATVTQDFDLDQEITIQGKKATIAWSVDEAYEAYIEVSEDGTKCIVHQSSLNPEVMIKATFTYNGKTTTKNYRFTVSKEVSEMESIDAWYYNIGSSITVSGYVVAVGTAYSEQHGNVTLYVVNEDLTAGFYLYRVKADKTNGAKLEAGKYVTVTGALSTNFGGLRESSSTGTVEVDDTKPTKDVSEMFYAVDEDLLGNVPAALYSQSRPVTLTGWQVTEVTKEHSSSSPTVVLKVKKGDVTISVLYSKYVEGCYNYTKGTEDPTVAAILAKVKDINVGDYVNIKGILGANSNLPQITLMGADGIEAGTADAEGTTHPGVAVGATIAKVQKEIETNKLLGLITSNTEVTLTIADGDVAVTYEVMGETNDIAIEGGKITITPSVHAKNNIKATFTCGDYSTFDFFTLETIAMTEEEKVDYEADNFDFPLLVNAGLQEGYTNKGNTFVDVRVSYAGADENSAALISMFDGTLYIHPVDTNTKITMDVTFSIGDDDEEYEYTVEGVEVTVQPTKFVKYDRIAEPEAGKEYYLGTHSIGSGQLGVWLFADGKATSNGFYLSATDDVKAAAKFTATAGETAGTYILKCGDKFVQVTHTSSGNNIKLVEAEADATPLKLSGEGATMYFAMVDGNDEYALVQNYTNKQIYIAKKDPSHFNNDNYSQYQLLEVSEDTTDTQGRATAVANSLTLAAKINKDLALPTTSNLYNDVFISWALKEAKEGQSVENNTLKITRGEEDFNVVLIATATCGVKSATKEITVTIEANAKVVLINTLVETAMAAEANATLNGQYEVSGYVKAVTGAWNDSYGNMTVVISDATGAEITLYRTTTKMTVGDAVTVVGYVEKNVYNDATTIRFKQGHTIKSHQEATLVTPTELYNIFADGNATDEQKNTVYLVIAPVTKIVNTPGGTYTTGNYYVADETGTVEAYKLGQMDGETAELLKIKVGTVLVFFGKATKFNNTVETTPSTLVSMYTPETTELTLTPLATIAAGIESSDYANAYIKGVVEFVVEGENGVLSGVASQTADGVTTYVSIAFPAGSKATTGSEFTAKIAGATATPYGVGITVSEVVSCLYPVSVSLGSPIEVEMSGLTTSGFKKITVSGVTVANKAFAMSETVTASLFADPNFEQAYDLADGDYNLTGYCIPASESTYAFYVLNWEKALPKAVLKANVTSNTDAAAATTAGNLTETLNLDPTLFTVTYDKNGASSELAIRTDGIRLYATKSSEKGNKLTVTAKEGITIVSIKITYDTGYSSTSEIIVGGNVVAGTDGAYDINASAFTIYDNNSKVTSNTQVRFQSITIFYTINE